VDKGIRKKGGEADHKPSSVPCPGLPENGDDHSSRTAVACCLKRHYTRTLSGPLLLFSYLVLLRMGFTMLFRSPGKRWALTSPFHPYPTESGGIFSVALSLGLPPVVVSDHPALWSSDFPLVCHANQRSSDLLRHPLKSASSMIEAMIIILLKLYLMP